MSIFKRLPFNLEACSFMAISLLVVASAIHAEQSITSKLDGQTPLRQSLYGQALATSKREKIQENAPRVSIVFVPGDGGSQLEARLNKTHRVHHICALRSDWFVLWLNMHLLTPLSLDCLSDNMRMLYNATSGRSMDNDGVQIRPANFGLLDGIDFLDQIHMPKTDYFENIIKTLETNNELIRNVNMAGAPFDFRRAPNELEEFFVNLSSLIEHQYVRNNYRPITLICHSMGCLNSVYLLNSKSDSWKDIYIRRLIALAAPWDGSVKAISTLLFGDNLGIPMINNIKLQKLQVTFPSLMYLFPKSPTFSKDRVLLETKQVNYSLNNLDNLFKATGLLDQLEMYHQTQQIASLQSPNVEIWCLHGSGIKTVKKISFHGPLGSKSYKEIYGDGDGTVNLESLRACKLFRQYQFKPVYVREFKGIDHIGVLRGAQVANFISQTILNEVSLNHHNHDYDNQI